LDMPFFRSHPYLCDPNPEPSGWILPEEAP